MTEKTTNQIQDVLDGKFDTLKALLRKVETSKDVIAAFDAGYYTGLYRAVLPIEEITRNTCQIAKNLDEGNALSRERAREVSQQYLLVVDCRGPVAEIVLELLDLTAEDSTD